MPSPPATRTERRALVAAALAFFAVLAALPVGRALFDPGRVALAVDTATAQLPWSAVIGERAGEARPRNPALSDQGVGFYPFYRWVGRSWREGDPPLWNPLLYLGAPGLGNPQYGVLDPQVLVLLPLEAWFGIDGFHLGLAWLAFLRLVAAGAGAFLLARRLGLSMRASLLAGVAFQSSGYVQLWLNFSLGHVTPFLPWMLLFIEGCRGERRGASAFALALATAGAVLGGHPETAFYVGAAGGVWALAVLREERRAGVFALLGMTAGGLLAFPSVLPFLEYLARSGAHVLREGMVRERAIDLVALGAVLALVGALRAGVRARRAVLAGAGVVAATFAVALLLRARGLPETAGLAFVQDLFGHPARAGGYSGPGTHVEEASAWIPSAALALAFASAAAPVGALRRRALVLALGFVAWALALRVPGLLELKQQLPVVGLGATVRFASVGCLMLALAAGDALDSAGPRARVLGAALFAALLFAWARPPAEPRLDDTSLASPESDDLVRFAVAPRADGGGSDPGFEAWVSADVPVALARTRLTRVGDEHGASQGVFPADEIAAPTAEARLVAPDVVEQAPADARWFVNPFRDGTRLGAGVWLVELELVGADGSVLGARRAGVITIAHRSGVAWWSAALIATGVALVAVGGRRARASASAAVVAIATVEGLAFALGLNPTVPADEAFPQTRSEALLAEHLGVHRFFSDQGVLPPDTGLVRGLRALDGYDGLDVATYNAYRPFALQRGVDPLLGWNARGAALDSPLYRVLGVSMLALHSPLAHPRFELVAAPDGSAPREAELFLYRDREPYDRAFVVTEVVSAEEAWQQILAGTFDPLRTATFDGEFRTRTAASEWRVHEGPVITNTRVALTVELDGDGLLVLTEQAFPGWFVRVGAERREPGTANGVFRAVPLGPGRHEVVFEYRPRSFTLGLVAAGIGALLAAGLVVAGRTRV